MVKKSAGIFLITLLLLLSSYSLPQKASAEWEINIGGLKIGTGMVGDAINAALGTAGEHLTKFVGDALEGIFTATTVMLTGALCPDGDCGEVEGEGALNNPYLRGGLVGEVAGIGDYYFENTPRIDAVDIGKTMFANNILGIGSARADGLSELSRSNTDGSTTTYVQDIWTATRNAAYLFFILIMMVMGLMILFRYQLDPRTVVSVQNSIPRIIVGLILITFSLPIAGLLLDFGMLLKGLIDSIFASALGDKLQDINVRRISLAMEQFKSALGDTIGESGAGTSITGIAAWLIAVASLIIALMVVFEFLKRLVYIYILAMFAPLAFLWGTLPGQGDTIKKWFSMFMVSVLSIPAIYLFVSMAYWIGATGRKDIAYPSGLGLTYAGDPTANLNGIIGMAFIILASKVPAVIEDLLAIKEVRGGVDVGKALKKLPVLGKFA